MELVYFLLYMFFEILVSFEFAKIFTPVGLFLEIIISAFIGVTIIRTLNFSMYESMQKVMRREITQEEFISIGLFKFLGAILLIIPGVLTDIIGIMLMFEPFAKWFGRKFFIRNSFQNDYNNSEIIDVEIIEEKKL